MISILTTLTLILVLVIVALVAWHLIGIYIALKRGADHLEKLAGGLVAIRDNSAPLNGKVDEINTGLAELLPPLLAANGNLAAIVKVAGSR
jgi:cell division protein FtsB